MFMNIMEFFFSEKDKFDNGKYYFIIIDNNQTCWNLIYLIIQHAFYLQYWIEKFYFIQFNKDKNFSNLDIFNNNNQDKLAIFSSFLSLIY